MTLAESAPPTAAPPVTVVLPTLNERSAIVDCLDSLSAQTYPNIAEVLVVDGGSTDGTRSIVERRKGNVRLVDNPGRTAANAMNNGLAAANTDVIVRVDAHTHYAPDYVAASVEALHESGADWVGGPMRPVGLTSFGRSVSAVTSSPLGIGNGAFHYATEACDVDTVYLGTFDRRIVEEVGGYDTETLQWAAEDQELNYRLRLAGRRIRLDPRIRSWYFPRQTPGALFRQYRNYGICKASTLKKHRRLPYLRPLAPAALVAGSVVIGVAGIVSGRRLAAVAPLVSYGAGSFAAAFSLSDDPGVAPHRAWGALAIMHWGYGLGFWQGVLRIVRRQPFDTIPKGS